jgi:hypothetical protein
MSAAEWLLRQGTRAGKAGWIAATSAAAHTIALGEKWRPAVRSVTPGAAPLGPRVALFCHWDGGGRVREHTRRYVEALRAEGLSVVLASNAERLTAGDAKWAASVCAVVILRRNLGYDFGAWRDALVQCALPRPETTQIILLNDSVYGPFRPLAEVLRRIDASPFPICGLTDSWQRRYHLQSYFVAFREDAFRHRAWQAFWQQVLPSRSKHHVVVTYEIGLTQAMLRANIGCDVLWPYEGLVEQVLRELDERDETALPNAPRSSGAILRDTASYRIASAAASQLPMNPTADLWSVLLDQGFPFIKRELVRSNPSQVRDVARWHLAVEAIAPGEAEIVRRDLRLALRRRTP